MRTLLFFLSMLLSSVPLQADVASHFTRFAGFKLAQDTTLPDVMRKLGPAPLLERGEAGGYEASICYITSGGRLSFLSGEMGGSDHTLLGFSVAEISPEDSRHCGRPTGHLPEQLLIGDLALGMTRTHFSRILGGNIEWKKDTGKKTFSAEEPIATAELELLQQSWTEISEHPYFDITVSITATFHRDRLIEFRIWKIRSI